MGSLSFRKTVYPYTDGDGIEHYFCSEECQNEWKKKHITTIESADMELLYYKKLEEYEVWTHALATAVDDEERRQVQKKREEAERELRKLGEILGKD